MEWKGGETMKIIGQALAGALVLHMAYMGIVFLIGLLQTYFYKPQFSTEAVVLQSEVSFGSVAASPIVYVSSIIIVAIVIALVLMGRKQLKKQ
jgi:hypothetical protein